MPRRPPRRVGRRGGAAGPCRRRARGDARAGPQRPDAGSPWTQRARGAAPALAPRADGADRRRRIRRRSESAPRRAAGARRPLHADAPDAHADCHQRGRAVTLAELATRTDVTAVAYDSRQVKPGAIFVALRGVNADGARFAAQAIASGAIAVVAESAAPAGVSVPWIQV